MTAEATPGFRDSGVAGTGVLQRGVFVVCGVCFAKLLSKAVECLLVEPQHGFLEAVEAFFADLMVRMGNVVRRRLKPPLSISRGAFLSIINHVPFAAAYASLLV